MLFHFTSPESLASVDLGTHRGARMGQSAWVVPAAVARAAAGDLEEDCPKSGFFRVFMRFYQLLGLKFGPIRL